MSGEGKSFVSINLAATLSTPESKVLLLEMDLRKPKFSKYLNLEPAYGLNRYSCVRSALFQSNCNI